MASGRPRLYSAEGIVLGYTDLGEADRIITFLTPGRGILRASARGVRKPGSKLGGHLDLLCHVLMSIHEGRSLHGVSQVETVSAFRPLRQDIGRLSRALYIAELAQRFSVEDAPNPAVFRLLAEALQNMSVTDAPDLLLRWFELRLLSFSGFAPEVYQCADCHAALAQEPHVFSPERGGLVCPDCRGAGSDTLLPAGVPAIKVLRFLVRNSYETVRRLTTGDEARRQVERILRSHLQAVLDRNLRSTAFLDEVRSWPDVGPVPGGLKTPELERW